MGRNALVIKGANFATNKLDTITFVQDEKPCTGIELDQSSKTVTELGNFTLTATVTPADTTDDVLWSTSDATVATVSDGVVTVVGLGTATITATCGEQTATCAVACNEVTLDYYPMFAQLHSSWGSTYSTAFPIESYQYGVLILGDDKNLGRVRTLKNQSANTALNSCPIMLPPNTAAVEVSYGADMRNGTIYFGWMDTRRAAGETTQLQDCAYRVSMNSDNSSAYNQAKTWVYAVPSGADSFALQLKAGANAWSESDTPEAIATAKGIAIKALASVPNA